jgi:hypothetical protein
VLGEPEPYLAVDNVLGAAGKTVRGPDGGSLRLADVTQGPAGQVKIRFALDPPGGAAGGGGVAQLRTRGGRAVVTREDGLEHELALVDDRGGELRPEGVGSRVGPGGVEFTAAYRPGPGGGKPARLVYTVSRGVAVEVPFALRNVPLR